MSGRSSPVLSELLWPDAEVERLSIDYESVQIVLRDPSGLMKAVRCSGYIGYRVRGFWDEVVVERAEFVEDGTLLRECVEQLNARLGKEWIDSGSSARNTREFSELQIILSDGARIEVVASEFSVEPAEL